MFTRAIVRRPGPDFAAGLTTSKLGPPDPERMRVQHLAYVEALRALGLKVEVLDALPGFPDAYFVEDVAVVVPELAIVTLPGAASRREEAGPMAPVLARYREVARLRPPATLDGGDVLVAGQTVFVGLSARTNAEGASQLQRLLEPSGYRVRKVPVAAGLHFKSSVNWLGGDTLLVSERFADRDELRGFRHLVLDIADEAACNTLLVNGTLLAPAGFPGARQKLERAALPIVELEVSEARKMDGGLTCMSLRL